MPPPKRSSRSWNKAKWKNRRKKIIGDKCVNCGSTQGPFVLQHHWHPPPWKQVLKETAHKMGMCIYADPVKIEANRTYHILQIRYESCVDASTYCRKCAFMEDIRGKILCKWCEERWHDPRYSMCYQCYTKNKTGSLGL